MSAGLGEDGKVHGGVRAAAERIIHVSELLVVSVAEALMVLAILIATVVLMGLFVSHLRTSAGTIETLDDLQDAVEKVFAGVLLLLLGLELLKSLSSFFVGYRVQVEIIVVVAMIAVARHIMLTDFEHADPMKLIAVAALVLALAVSYALVRQRRAGRSDSDG
jgi:uncharacterized membrane protein (DUF373 family)